MTDDSWLTRYVCPTDGYTVVLESGERPSCPIDGYLLTAIPYDGKPPLLGRRKLCPTCGFLRDEGGEPR